MSAEISLLITARCRVRTHAVCVAQAAGVRVRQSTEAYATPRRKQRFLAALASASANVSEACRKSGVPRATHYGWIAADADYCRAVRDVEEAAFDVAEQHLFENIRAGKERSLIFFLKTRGRHRGYSETSSLPSASAGDGGDCPASGADSRWVKDELPLDKLREVLLRVVFPGCVVSDRCAPVSEAKLP